MTSNTDFQSVFDELKLILASYADSLEIVQDEARDFHVNTKYRMKNGKPMYFGSVKINKNYVSFHLMPVYVFPLLIDNMSPELKKRMQGKSCFNFKSVDVKLFSELRELTGRGYAQYKESGYLQNDKGKYKAL